MVHAWGNFGQPLGELRSTLGGIPGFRIQTSATHARGLPQTQATNPRRPHVKRKNTRLCSGSLRVVHGMRRWINSAGTCDQRYLCFLRGNRSGFSPKCNQFPATLPAAAMDLTILPACTAPPQTAASLPRGALTGCSPSTCPIVAQTPPWQNSAWSWSCCSALRHPNNNIYRCI